MATIQLNDIHLTYHIKGEKKIKDLFVKNTHRKYDPNATIHALRGVNLTLKDGDRLGIIGHNGAGKSSFLKLVAGIYPPTRGERIVKGKIASLFELATGFEPEATGWENIELRGLMLGETPQSIRRKMPEIAEFSELGRFLDMPVKHYSSGMFIRLAFSISTAIEPDILLLDEVMAAGDAAFLEKSQHRMRELMDSVKILIFVSHSMESVVQFCNRALLIEQGSIIQDADPQTVIKAYQARQSAHAVKPENIIS